MQWTNESVLQFLEIFKTEPCIWNPRNKQHKNRTKNAEAWARIQEEFSAVVDDCTVDALKRKKDSLMASYRTLLREKKKSIESGKAGDDVFKPIWFAFETMDKFLGIVYNSYDKTDTEAYSLEPGSDDWNVIVEDVIDEDGLSEPRRITSSLTKKHINAKRKREVNRNTSCGTQHAVEHIELPFKILKEVGEFKENEKDDCDLYVELLVKKLRRFNEDERESLMLEIDALLLERKRQISANCLSPAHTFNSSSSSQAEDVVQCILNEEDQVQRSKLKDVSTYYKNFSKSFQISPK